MVSKKKVRLKRNLSSPTEKKAKKFLSNYWAISTVILGILLIIALATQGMNNSTGASISSETAGSAVIEFAEGQGASASVIEVKDAGSLYEVVVEIQGQQVPVYVTKDGDNLVPSIIPLKGANVDSATPAPSTPESSNIPKSDKPTVELFVMSICPYGTQMEKGILPVLDALGDSIDFELKFVYYAMHDKPEIDENNVQYCVQKEYGRTKLQEYLYCYLQDYDTDVWNKCITDVGLDESKIDSCVASANTEFGVTAAYEDQSSWLSGRFPIYPVDQADNEKYGVGGSPTLVINGVTAQVGRSPAIILDAICGAFNNAPEACNTELDTATYQPGFGFGTAPTSASAAACGAY